MTCGDNWGGGVTGFSSGSLDAAAGMVIFDLLPPRIRELVNVAPVKWSVLDAWEAVCEFGADGAELLIRRQNVRARHAIRAELETMTGLL